MGVELYNKDEKKAERTMADMEEGEIAEITGTGDDYNGTLIQYCGEIKNYHLWVVLGEPSGSCFYNQLKSIMDYKIRTLEAGELIEITKD